MEYIESLTDLDISIYILKTFFMSIFTYHIALKSINEECDSKIKIVGVYIAIVITVILCSLIKSLGNVLNSMICLVIFLSLIFSKYSKKDIGYSSLIIMVSLSINYSVFIMATAISFVPSVVLNIRNDYINLVVIIIIYAILINSFSKVKRLKQGFLFLQKKLDNEYFDVLILNVSIVILFSFVLLENYNKVSIDNFGFGFIAFAIIMFITIQKSLQLYYKQKLLIQDLNETKKELGEKKQEIKQLEKEILSFSKTSHSIVHEQKLLKYKLDELMLKNEIAVEIDIRDRINNISKEICKEAAVVELFKTGISEIDNVLEYMQSECVKNKIDFQVQINGNIHYMMNHYIAKENLKILLADHIKNAIIAINYSKNRNKSILVRLGKIEGIYSLYVYDSGIEFEIETLLNLGKKPMTTHRDDGGTGMGFMNTFDTLKEHRASMTIYEYSKPKEEDFTKLIMIKFDKKNEFKICSYRSEEIKKEDDIGNLTIEKIEN